MPDENTFITLPEDLANPLMAYLEKRAEMVRKRGKDAADAGQFESSLSLGNMANCLLVTRSLIFSDFRRTQMAAQLDKKVMDKDMKVVQFAKDD